MRKIIVAAVVALCGCSQPSRPDNFRALRWGISKAEVRAQLRDSKLVEKSTSSLTGTLGYQAEDVLEELDHFGDLEAAIRYEFTGGHFNRVGIVFLDPFDFSIDRDRSTGRFENACEYIFYSLTKKYGPPALQDGQLPYLIGDSFRSVNDSRTDPDYSFSPVWYTHDSRVILSCNTRDRVRRGEIQLTFLPHRYKTIEKFDDRALSQL